MNFKKCILGLLVTLFFSVPSIAEKSDFLGKGEVVVQGAGSLASKLTGALKSTYDDIIRLGGSAVENNGVLKLLGKNGDEVAQITNGKILPTKYFDDVADANNHTTHYTYNGLGRMLTTTSSTGIQTNYQQSWSIDEPVENVLYYTKAVTPNEVTAIHYYDAFGRLLYAESFGFDGSLVITAENTYNNKGQLTKALLAPYTQGEAINYTTYNYDDLGRLENKTNIFGITNYTYNATTTIVEYVTVDGTQATTSTTDATGLVTQTADNGGTINYQYNSFGKPTSINAVGTTTTMSYNAVGMQTSLIDANAGITNYSYNAFGELTQQTDANGNTFTMTYDMLGRISIKENSETGSVLYKYDGENARGLIGSETNFTNNTYIQYAYDEQSRLKETEEKIGDKTFVYNYTYDNHNRLITTQYPSGYTTKNEYNALGYLNKILNGSNQLLWQCNTVNAQGNIEEAQLGNGVVHNLSYNNQYRLNDMKYTNGATQLLKHHYEYDAFGNMGNRKDNLRNLEEKLSYDNLNRLSNINGSQISYSNNGNITNKYDAGEYSYPTSGTQPHAVAQIENPQNISSLQQDVVYNSFNKVQQITEDDDVYKHFFYYNTQQQRNKAEFTQADVLQNTRYYAGAVELDQNPNGDTRLVEYISAPTGLIALHVKNTPVSGSASDSLYYIGTDHLGSIVLIMKSNGAVVQERSYDAWGRLRNPIDWTYDNVQGLAVIERGYTGHEHLSRFALINMNGRLYDPIVGRMLSPDNYVQDPDFTQSYNRYSYCWNNPLKYTDPSGEFVWVIPNVSWSLQDGMSVGISVGFGIPNGASGQVGIGYNFQTNDFSGYAGATLAFNTIYTSYSMQNGFSVGYTAGLSMFSGVPVSSNFATVGINYNFKSKSLSGNISSWNIDKNGSTFNPSISIMVYPEETTNFARGQSFRNNDQVLTRFVAAKNQQGALDYFGFEGTYDVQKAQGNPGATDTKTGEISYSDYAFEGNYDRLAYIHDHEMYHRRNVLAGKYSEYNGNIPTDISALEEFNAYMYGYKRQGLFSDSGTPFVDRIKSYGLQAGLYGPEITPTGTIRTNTFTPKIWHTVYRIPRVY